jgi:serine/threonine-protein kinase
MSTVYLARDETLERWVAVKLLHREISDEADQIERFRREARTVAQLSHPNVVSVIDAGEDQGRPYIVFEHVAGQTLKQCLDRAGRLPMDEAVAYAIEIGRGLAAAHACGVVHRDVKPQNVLIDSEGRAKVTDFGIARSLEADGLTKTGRVLGTTDYVSPEQAMGQDVDARSDVYSLGVLLYEMVTGEVPFRAETVVGVAMKHVNERMPDVQSRRPDASSAVAAVIERATAKDRERRYADMQALLGDLQVALEVEVARSGGAHGEATTVLDSVGDPKKMLTSRRVSAAGVALVLAATVAALLVAAFTGDDERGSSGSAAASGAQVEIVGAEDFDPVGGDGEHPEEVQLAIDGDPATAWTTETYSTSAELDASGKPGVGLILDAGRAVTARRLDLQSVQGGWDVEVYGASSGPPASIEDWGEELGSVSGVSEEQTVELSALRPSRYYLVWITKLSPTAVTGGYRVEIEEAELTR